MTSPKKSTKRPETLDSSSELELSSLERQVEERGTGRATKEILPDNEQRRDIGIETAEALTDTALGRLAGEITQEGKTLEQNIKAVQEITTESQLRNMLDRFESVQNMLQNSLLAKLGILGEGGSFSIEELLEDGSNKMKTLGDYLREKYEDSTGFFRLLPGW